VELNENDYDGHRSLYRAAVNDHKNFFTAYLEACLDFSVEKRKEILQMLFEDGVIGYAQHILFSVPQKQMDEKMFYFCGICCYEQGALAEAKAYFSKVKRNGYYKAGAESYLSWIEERENSR
jgi:hypothetical protein